MVFPMKKTLAAYDSSLEKMGLDYLDLYLVHWPGIDQNYIKVYKALEKFIKMVEYAQLVLVISMCII